MKDIPIAVQLFSVRDECEKDLAKTIAAVAKIGYTGVEFAGYYGKSGKEIKKMLADNGLQAAGCHTGLDTLQPDKIQQTIEFNLEYGNKRLICPWIGKEVASDVKGWKKMGEFFKELGSKLKPHGMVTGYHNHGHDLQPLEGTTPWDAFFGSAGKDMVVQVDIGNAYSAVANPMPQLENYPGQVKTIHIKEWSKSNPKALVGEGDVPWKRVIDFCQTKGGTEWYIIEHEVPGQPSLEAVAGCLKNFKKLVA